MKHTKLSNLEKKEQHKPNIDALLECGFCSLDMGTWDTDKMHFNYFDPSPCDKCELNFNYTGQYVGDTPYGACDVLADILNTIVSNREQGGKQ